MESQRRPARCGRLRMLFGILFALSCLVCASLYVYSYYWEQPRWDKAFGPLDERFYFAPQAFLLDVSLRNGEFPLWNPLSYCGMPFAADPQASACYPPHLVRSLLTPAYDPWATTASLHILRLLHLLWAGLGVICLARLYKLSLPAALVGALAFMFNAFNIIYFTEFYVYPLVIVWAPWVLWAAKRAFDETETAPRIVYAVFTTIFFAYSTLAGFPQLSLYLGLLLGFFGIFDFLLNRKWGFRLSSLARNCRAGAGRALLLGAIAVLTILASSVLLLPAMELGGTSARVAASGVEVAEVTQEFDPLHMLKCVLFFPGNTWMPLGPRGAGIGALLVALAAFTHKKRRNALIYFLLYLVLTDCTLGPPFPIGALLHRYDILNITVSPWRAGSFASMPFAMLVAFGVDAAGRAPARYWARAARALLLAAFGAAMLYMLRAWLREDVLQQTWLYVWHIPLAALIAVCVFSLLPLPRLGRWTVGLLIAAEIIAWSAQMLPAYVSKRVSNKMPTASFGEYQTLSVSNRRGAVVRPNWNMFSLDYSMAGYNPLYVGETRKVLCRIGYENFYRGHLKGEDVTVENQRGNLLMKRSFWLARQWAAGELPPKEDIYPASTTVFLTDTPSGAPLPVPEIPHEALPRHAVSDTVEEVDLGLLDMSKAVARGRNYELRLPAFDQDFAHSALYIGYHGTVPVEFTPLCRDELGFTRPLRRSRTVNTAGKERFLEIPLPDCGKNTITLAWSRTAGSSFQLTRAYVAKDLEDEDDRIVIESRSANTALVTLHDLSGPRILTFLDSWYPGWTAYIDGKEAEILKANDAFKAVVVPAGTHSVFFGYYSETTRTGFMLTVGTFTLLLIVLAVAMFWGRSQGTGVRG
ncbi:MAG: hypothetical protein GXY07_17575 [Candidatus Hydrogenedentes bacterium]|nr:hypothetical protein [Candidatus Hydrogenedentota bacterium]